MDDRTADTKDRKLWPIAIERHFIEVLLEEDAKRNMPQGQFKTGTCTTVMNEFNKHTNRDYNETQLTQKYQRMKGQHCTFSQLIARTRMGWDPISNTMKASEKAWAATFTVNHKFKELKKRGLKHYDLLGKLFNSNTATSFLQISSTQPAPNSDEERELDAAFLSEGVHVNVNIDGVDDVEELPTLSEAQSRRQAEKWPTEPSHSSRKRKKGHSLESMIEVI
nr:l10-interacting myb domain-containing protein [Quercus suber]